MLIHCKKCNSKNSVTEVQELEDIENFTNRILIIGVCRNCNKDIAMLVETRKSDNKPFIDSYHDIEAIKVIKREKKRLKNKVVEADTRYYKWIYGKNVEIKNKNGKVVQIRQYACDYRTNKRKLIKTINFWNERLRFKIRWEGNKLFPSRSHIRLHKFNSSSQQKYSGWMYATAFHLKVLFSEITSWQKNYQS